MAKKPLIFPRLSLLFLICSSFAWVGNGAAHGPVPVLVKGREVVGGAGGAEPLWRRIPGVLDGGNGPHPRSPPAAEPAPAAVVRDGCQAMITPPPSLLSRQDQGQIQALSNQLQQLSQQSRSVSQASQQVSQSSQQLSQSLQQATQRLSQTEQQLASARLQQSAAESASRSMSQASAEASRRADEARASADRAISEVMRSASQSAGRAFSEDMASVTSSMGASFSSALRMASQSADAAMRSAVSVAQKAQADATALRNEANTQIQQAQGAALSVTQTALAVVGGIVGSSLLTGVGFVLVLRHRRKKRRQLRRGDSINGAIGYPQLTGTSNKAYSVSSSKRGYATSDDGSSTYSTDDNGFKFPAGTGDIKRPGPTAVSMNNTATRIARRTLTPGVGYAVSFYGPRPSLPTNQPRPQFQLGNPPPPRGAAGGKFRLFPATKFGLKPTNQDGNMDRQRDVGPQATSASSSASGASAGPLLDDRGRGKQGTERLSNGSFPSLNRWLREGTDVSPFSTLKGPGNASARR